MKRSQGTAVLFVRHGPLQTCYLSRWNPEWRSYQLLGGQPRPGETHWQAAMRETRQSLLQPDDHFSIIPEPVACLRYRAFSEHSGQETEHCMQLFEGSLSEQIPDEVLTGDHRWLSLEEIQRGVTDSGQTISSELSLLLMKTGRLPICRDPSVWTIGVTGHRDLSRDQLPRLRERLNRLLDDAEFIGKGRPITLLSPLAVGADQLVAEEGLLRGYRLVAPLPLPPSRYRANFPSREVQQLDLLLESASEWFTLPHPAGASSFQPLATQSCRKEAYLRPGRHIVDRCDLLIVLWDGCQSQPEGGTASTLRYALHNNSPHPKPHISVCRVKRAGSC